MIALLTTYLILAYVLVPGVLFRTPASWFIKLRLFELTRTEEAVFACFVSSIPFIFAAVAVWYFPFARSHPFELPEPNRSEYRTDYRRTLTLIVAEDPARFLEANPPAGQRNVYIQSLNNIGRRQLRFLSWYYSLTVAEGILFGFLTKNYGEWSELPTYEWFARTFFLPRVSEWQLLLTDFAFPKKPKRDVLADVLCGDHLYRGRIGDYFLNKSGELSGLLLKDVARFRRNDYEDARDRQAGENIDREPFWRKIPGANFYIPASQMTNLNLRFPYESSSDLTDHLLDFLKQLGVRGNITIEQEVAPDGQDPATTPEESGRPETETGHRGDG